MVIHQKSIETVPDDLWEDDFRSPSCLADFVWPEGVELRGNVNLVDRKMIDREEVAEEWSRVRDKLLKAIA